MPDAFDKMMKRAGFCVSDRFSRVQSAEDSLLLRVKTRNWALITVCVFFLILLAAPLVDKALIIDKLKKPDDVRIVVGVLLAAMVVFAIPTLYSLLASSFVSLDSKEFWRYTRFLCFKRSRSVLKASFRALNIGEGSSKSGDSHEVWNVNVVLEDGSTRALFTGEPADAAVWIGRLLSQWAGVRLDLPKPLAEIYSDDEEDEDEI